MKQNYFQLNYFSNDITSRFSIAGITVPKIDVEWSRNCTSDVAPLNWHEAGTPLKELLN